MKYPRSYHLYFSPGATSDDRIAISTDSLINTEIIITEKMDGSNTANSHPMWGKKHSDESNRRRAQKLLGKNMSLESSIKKSISLRGQKSWNKGRRLSDDDKNAKSIAALRL